MTCVPSGFRASGKRSSLRGLAIPRHPTLTSKKADRFGSPPATAHHSKYARKYRETTGLCQDMWNQGGGNIQCSLPLPCGGVNSPADVQDIRVRPQTGRDAVQFGVGLSMVAKLKPTLSGLKVMAVWWLER